MKNKKRNTIITCIIVGIVLLIGCVLFFLNHSVVDNGLSVLEKKWITDHANQVIDVQVYNDVPVYGYNGNGINFDFLDYFTEKYHISFNKISYYQSIQKEKNDFGFFILDDDEKVGKQDIVFHTDHYVVVALDKNVHVDIDNIQKLGILKEDSTIMENYFSQDVELVIYDNVQDMIEGINSEEVSYVSIPILQYMDKILENQLDIVFHLEDLKKNYVFRILDENVYEIMRKTYLEYLQKDYMEDYSKSYLSIYFNSTNTNDISRKNYNSKIYHYGYVVNMPFENVSGKEFVGTISNYFIEFERISSSEIEVIQYSSIDDLKSAMVSGEVDFALSNFDYQNLNLNYVTTNTIRDLEYLVLSKKDYSINSIKGLTGQIVSVIAGSKLYYLCKEDGIEVKTFSNTDDLLRGVNDESIVLLDFETYQYYRDNKLKDYHILLRDTIQDGYRFILNSSNDTFNKLFQFYVDSTDYNDFMYQYRTDIGMDYGIINLKVIIFIVALVLFLVATIIFMNRKNVTNIVPKKEDRLKYIDPMTSLKNRNYLNSHIYSWDDNVIFPQSVIVFDLDHIKRVNDKFGREAGDEIIKKAASILINQQLENTDIIRSDGDEFIIYMVGYDEKRVSEYMKKLLKLMRDIPKALGVEAGYSMIYDEVKTVDDAINEAILMMMKKKEDK